ncbi:hypothetical protein NC652_025806 [Populus alba x Populus x berolinensis]|nr:hypothetical protein NC652_025799 [Populus alba x Populus x berolinensis]KAJ6899457.1 hypothetical protein NC652_025806 [Populus alba x Populus x berolinensis]
MIGAEIFKRALSYPARLIAKNAGVNGNVVINQVLSNADIRYGYNAATDTYEDLITAGIIDPTKVVRCCLEHATSVAKTFLTSDAVIVDIKESDPLPMRRRMPPVAPPPMPKSPGNLEEDRDIITVDEEETWCTYRCQENASQDDKSCRRSSVGSTGNRMQCVLALAQL